MKTIDELSLNWNEMIMTTIDTGLGAAGAGVSGHSTGTLPANARGFSGRGDVDRQRLSRSVAESRDMDRSFYAERNDLDRSLYSERDRGYLSDMSSR